MNLLREGEVLSYPHLPPFRLNRDGRLGVRVGVPERDIEIYLISPETLTKPFLQNKPGITGLASLDPTVISAALIEDQVSGEFQTRALCDPDQSKNPYQCGKNNDEHCYDLSLIGLVTEKNKALQFASLDLRIQVQNPHTAESNIAHIKVLKTHIGEPIENAMDTVFEPSMTGDGLLWLGKFTSQGKKRWTWENPETGQRTLFPPRARPIVYSMNTKAACDIDGWTEFSPISHAAYDPKINKRYGFAHYLMRDPEGNTIADGDIIAADQYPWISRDGSMLFLETGGDMLFYYDDIQEKVSSRYPARCASEDNCLWNSIKGQKQKENIRLVEMPLNINRNVSMLGAWTHGKMVIVDNALNFMDYAPNDGLDQHFYVSLYNEQNPLSDNKVHRSGEVLMANNKQLLHTIRGSSNEGAQLGSVENRFNHLPNMKPKTQRDIVWLFSKGNGASVELVFDDYISHEVLIYAPMTASFANADALSVEIQGIHNGFHRTGDLSGKGFNGHNPIRIQNAATSAPSISSTQQFMAVPAYGEVEGDIRIEPYALGGIEGKGLWFDGKSRLYFHLPKQSSAQAYKKKEWYLGVFLDNREQENSTEALIVSFPDGSTVWQAKHAWVLKSKRGKMIGQYQYGDAKTLSWQHLGIRIAKKNIRLYHNGMPVAKFPRKGTFSMKEGELSLGLKNTHSTQGFKGWIDDVKVIALHPKVSEQILCEHARGTLIASEASLPKHTPVALPEWHQAIKQQIHNAGEFTDKAVSCFTNYTSESGAHAGNVPTNAVPLRALMLQPKNIIDAKPRPDETNNVFCLSCHAKGLHNKLNLDALEHRDIRALDDPRRQPMQPIVNHHAVYRK